MRQTNNQSVASVGNADEVRQIARRRLRALLAIARGTPDGKIPISELAPVVAHALDRRELVVLIASRLDAIESQALIRSTVHAFAPE